MPLALPLATLGEPDWNTLGLVSAIVGCFLIANAILFEHPRRLVERYFGGSTGRLQSVREYIYNRVQTSLGFAFLLGGFGLQLVGRYRGDGALGGGPLSMVWVGVIVVVAVGLLFTGWWWSLLAFRRYVREYFTEHPARFDSDPAVVREVGELFGIETHDDDTVEEYVRRLRERADLDLSRRPPAASPRAYELAEAEETA